MKKFDEKNKTKKQQLFFEQNSFVKLAIVFLFAFK